MLYVVEIFIDHNPLIFQINTHPSRLFCLACHKKRNE